MSKLNTPLFAFLQHNKPALIVARTSKSASTATQPEYVKQPIAVGEAREMPI